MTLGCTALPEEWAGATKHWVTEGVRLASVQAGRWWLQPALTGNLQ